MLCSQGTEVPFEGTMSTVLVLNAMGLYYEITAATALAETEQGQGYTDGPHAGIPFQPCKTHSHNMAISIRGGKIKKRGTGNLTGSGEHRADSTNADRNIDEYAPSGVCHVRGVLPVPLHYLPDRAAARNVQVRLGSDPKSDPRNYWDLLNLRASGNSRDCLAS